MQLPETEPLPPEVLAEVKRLEAQRFEEQRQREDIMQNTTRNQRRVSLKLHKKQLKKHMKELS